MTDCLSLNFNFDFEDSKLKIYDKNNNPLEYADIIEYLLEEFELEPEMSVNVIMSWYMGYDRFFYTEKILVE